MNAFSRLPQGAADDWAEAKARFGGALVAEQSFTSAYIDSVIKTQGPGREREAEIAKVPQWAWDEDHRLTEIRSDLEDHMINTPAPDLAGALFKLEYARGRWTESPSWPDEWWYAILLDFRRLAEVARTTETDAPDPAALIAELDAIDSAIAATNQDRNDGSASASVDAAYALYARIEALPNTGAYLAVRARAIGSSVDNTGDVAKLDLGELSAHAESNAGELIRQVLACILNAAPKSGDTPMLNIEAAA